MKYHNLFLKKQYRRKKNSLTPNQHKQFLSVILSLLTPIPPRAPNLPRAKQRKTNTRIVFPDDGRWLSKAFPGLDGEVDQFPTLGGLQNGA